MKLLLDTHTFLWFISGDVRLSQMARAQIEIPSNQVFLSVASLWEIAIKLSLGRLHLLGSFEPFIRSQLELNQFELLPITIPHTAAVAELPFHHRDPFDRLIIAQSLVDSLPVVGADIQFDQYSVSRIW